MTSQVAKNSGNGSEIAGGNDDGEDENKNTGIDSKKKVSLEIDKVTEGYIRINFENSECTNLWVFDGFASEENDKCPSWGAEGVVGKNKTAIMVVLM